MADNTPDIKDLTGSEILSDVPDLLQLAMKANEQFQGEKPTTAVGWIVKLGFDQNGFIGAAAAAYDRLNTGPVTVDVVASLLGLTPGGLIDLTRGLAVKVIAQAGD